MVTYLQVQSFPEMLMVVHQTERFSNNPMLSHDRAIKGTGQYL